MAKLFKLNFQKVDTDYSPERKSVKKVMKTGADLKVTVGTDGSMIVLEEDIKKYWDYGGGIIKLEYAGDMEDVYFKPILSEPDFVDGQIKSKKNGEIIGYQG